MLRKEWTLIALICILAVILRMYNVSVPLADWHSFRQADTASVTREYVKHGIDILRPRYHDLSNIQSGKDNPEGYRMVEFPLINVFTATVIRGFALQEQEVLVGRLVSIGFSLITLVCLYLFGRNVSGKGTGVVAALLFAVLPYAVYYSRVILPEPAVLAAVMLSLVLFQSYAQSGGAKRLALAAVSFAVALLIKPFALFFFPVFAALAFTYKGLRAVSDIKLYGASIVSVVPLYLWRKWILQFPEGIPASDWLFNKANIRLTGAFFHWIFEVRIFTLILGIGLVLPLILGLLRKGKDWPVYAAWGVSMFAYLVILAGGNVQHDYYQVLLLPFLCLAVSRGIVGLWHVSPLQYHVALTRLSVLALLGLSLFVSWYTVRGYYQINHWEIVKAGRAADETLPPDAKVIAPYMGDTAFLFQINRTGWPLGFDIQDKIGKGAEYYVSTSYDDETNALMHEYKTVEKTPDFAIIDLREKL